MAIENYMPGWLVDPILQSQMKGTFGSGVDPQYSTQGSWGAARSDWAAGELAKKVKRDKAGLAKGDFQPHLHIRWNDETGEFERSSGAASLKRKGKFSATVKRVDELNAMLGNNFARGSEGAGWRDYTEGKGLAYNPFDADEMARSRAAFEGVSAPATGGYRPLSVELFKRMRPGYYAQDVARDRGALVNELIGKRMQARGLGGGFAGYGGRGLAESASKAKYKSGVQDIYSNVGESTSGALSEFYNILDPYRKDIG